MRFWQDFGIIIIIAFYTVFGLPCPRVMGRAVPRERKRKNESERDNASRHKGCSMLDVMRDMLYAFIPIFVAIDIFVILPIFLSLTEGITKEKRRAVERDSVITALAVGLSFIALGEGIFKVLGITANDFKIAGGLVLLIFAVLDLTGYSKMREQTGKFGVVPIGVPLLVGPAVLTTILVLVDHYGIVPTILSFVANLVVVWISFRTAPKIVHFLGRGGILAISKVMALLLASIAIMMIRLGLENIVMTRTRG